MCVNVKGKKKKNNDKIADIVRIPSDFTNTFRFGTVVISSRIGN